MAEEYDPSPKGNPSFLARRSWWQTWLVKLIGRNTPRCNEVVRILSRQMDGRLSLKTRIQLRMHYLICCWCQRYEEQLHVIRKAAKELPECDCHKPKFTLSEDAKERIKKAVRTTRDDEKGR